MFNLPIEIQRLIFEYDNTYRVKYNLLVLTHLKFSLHELCRSLDLTSCMHVNYDKYKEIYTIEIDRYKRISNSYYKLINKSKIECKKSNNKYIYYQKLIQ